ncbi:chemotaxis protein [Alkalihalobacillus pseudalcaliphilus]|nr:chemotaxis protein [Alkalihalobacillus pseudalcaliphilus]
MNETTGWIIAGEVNIDDFEEQAKEIIAPIFISVVTMVLLGSLLAIWLATIITKPLKQVMARMTRIANGDLTDKPLTISSENEIGQLMASTNQMSADMKILLKQINEVAESVSSQSEELTQTTDEVKQGTEQIAVTMEEIASGTETQATSASEISSMMTTFTSRVEEASEQGNVIEHNSKKVLEMTANGIDYMEKSSGQMDTINGIVKQAVEKMKSLDGQTQDISQLVSVIREIAEQTNLLALNAAIEAARAGEQGRGFTVVAGEVRKLAEQVAVSVQDITGIVNGIQSESKVLTESLQDGYMEVKSGTKQIESTRLTFNEISQEISNMAGSIHRISDNLTEMVADSQEMNSSIEEIAAISEEAAAGVEQTTASAQQVSSSMEEVSESSEQLSKLAEELNYQVNRFKL